jgi:hypothetical protein
MINGAVVLVYFSVSPQVGDDGEMATAAVDFAGECYRTVSAVVIEDRAVNLRFSPVWLYMCVCNELGRVKRLSQILHLCFFCELDETFELNWLIIDCGAGGMVPPNRPLGRGRVRELLRSTDSEAEL